MMHGTGGARCSAVLVLEYAMRYGTRMCDFVRGRALKFSFAPAITAEKDAAFRWR